MTNISQAEVQRRIEGLDEATQKRMICALVGHSKIQDYCFGYYYCARCGEQVGDSLGSIYPDAENVVILDHDCEICRANYKKCGWQDTLMTPDPYVQEEEA